MASTSNISIRLSNDLLERIKETGLNRNAFIKEAIEEKLNPIIQMPELTRQEKKEVIKEVKNLNDYVKDAIKQRLQQETDLLSNIPKDEFMQMVMRLLPKENLDNSDLEGDILSLQKCITALPGINDITHELNLIKHEYSKLEAKYKTAKKLLNHVQHKETFAELMEGIYKCLIEYVAEMCARNAIPGIGDGGGLTPQGYAEIADRVVKDLEKLKVIGKVGKW